MDLLTLLANPPVSTTNALSGLISGGSNYARIKGKSNKGHWINPHQPPMSNSSTGSFTFEIDQTQSFIPADYNTNGNQSQNRTTSSGLIAADALAVDAAVTVVLHIAMGSKAASDLMKALIDPQGVKTPQAAGTSQQQLSMISNTNGGPLLTSTSILSLGFFGDGSSPLPTPTAAGTSHVTFAEPVVYHV